MTAQVNQVRPGGEAQQPHRDYHLGFQQGEFVAEFPIPAQILSQYLTLQGAVAHSDMPLASGPTRLLPFSHQYELGYMAYRQPEFVDYFNQHYVQLPLQKGDGLFFNPALFHAAGNNTTTDHVRTANLLQISSAFGVPMEDKP
jgi:ectoine hydroxylase-related dioxygenase (phytanoyl-CoA dioxygenase family)